MKSDFAAKLATLFTVLFTTPASSQETCANLFECMLANELFVDSLIDEESWTRLADLTVGSVYVPDTDGDIGDDSRLCISGQSREFSDSITIQLDYRDIASRGAVFYRFLQHTLTFYGVETPIEFNNERFTLRVDTAYEPLADNIGRRFASAVLESESCEIDGESEIRYISNIAYTDIAITIDSMDLNESTFHSDGRLIISNCEAGVCINSEGYIAVGYSSKSFER